MAFLSAFTVYEFNEFASYYMTRPARDAAIQVQNHRQAITNLTAEITNATQRHFSINRELARIALERAVALEASKTNYEFQTATLVSDHTARISSLRATLPAPPSLDSFSEQSIASLTAKIHSLQAECDTRVEELRTQATERRTTAAAALEAKRKALETRRAEHQKGIAGLRQALLAELEGVSGAFKETKKNSIRARYQEQIDAVNAQVAELDHDLHQASPTADETGDQEIQTVRRESEQSIRVIESQIESIRAKANEANRD